MNDKDGPKGLHKGAPVSHDTVEKEPDRYEDGKEFSCGKQRTRENSAENILKDGMCLACCRNEPINCSKLSNAFSAEVTFMPSTVRTLVTSVLPPLLPTTCLMLSIKPRHMTKDLDNSFLCVMTVSLSMRNA